MREDHGRGRNGAIVQTIAAISISASADFEVEGAIDTILLGAKNTCEICSHGNHWQYLEKKSKFIIFQAIINLVKLLLMSMQQ